MQRIGFQLLWAILPFTNARQNPQVKGGDVRAVVAGGTCFVRLDRVALITLVV